MRREPPAQESEIRALTISLQVFATNTALQVRQVAFGAKIVLVRVFISRFHNTESHSNSIVESYRAITSTIKFSNGVW